MYKRQSINPGIELVEQQKLVLEQQQFQHHVQNSSVDARVSHQDLKWLVENLQPPAPPQAPPPLSQADSRADQERMAAELDGAMQERAMANAHLRMSQEVRQQLLAQTNVTAQEQIIREHHYHHVNQPIYIPTPAQPQPVLEEARRTGHTAAAYTHLRAHETKANPARRRCDEKKK